MPAREGGVRGCGGCRRLRRVRRHANGKAFQAQKHSTTNGHEERAVTAPGTSIGGALSEVGRYRRIASLQLLAASSRAQRAAASPLPRLTFFCHMDLRTGTESRDMLPFGFETLTPCGGRRGHGGKSTGKLDADGEPCSWVEEESRGCRGRNAMYQQRLSRVRGNTKMRGAPLLEG